MFDALITASRSLARSQIVSKWAARTHRWAAARTGRLAGAADQVTASIWVTATSWDATGREDPVRAKIDYTALVADPGPGGDAGCCCHAAGNDAGARGLRARHRATRGATRSP